MRCYHIVNFSELKHFYTPPNVHAMQKIFHNAAANMRWAWDAEKDDLCHGINDSL